MEKDSDFEFFNKLRVDTEHVRPFNIPSRYTTTFRGGLTVSAGKTVDIPVGRVDNRSNIIVDDRSPVNIDGKPVQGVERSTSRSYFFTSKPNEDAILVSEKYLQKVQNLVAECYRKFQQPVV